MLSKIIFYQNYNSNFLIQTFKCSIVFGVLPFPSMEYDIAIIQKCQTYYIIDRIHPGFGQKFIFIHISIKLGFNIFKNSTFSERFLKNI